MKNIRLKNLIAMILVLCFVIPFSLIATVMTAFARTYGNGSVYSGSGSQDATWQSNWKVYGSDTIVSNGSGSGVYIGSGTDNGQSYGATLYGSAVIPSSSAVNFTITDGGDGDFICLAFKRSSEGCVEGYPGRTSFAYSGYYAQGLHDPFYEGTYNAGPWNYSRQAIHDNLGYSPKIGHDKHGIDVTIRRRGTTGIDCITIIAHNYDDIDIYYYYENLPSLNANGQANTIGFNSSGVLTINGTAVNGNTRNAHWDKEIWHYTQIQQGTHQFLLFDGAPRWMGTTDRNSSSGAIYYLSHLDYFNPKGTVTSPWLDTYDNGFYTTYSDGWTVKNYSGATTQTITDAFGRTYYYRKTGSESFRMGTPSTTVSQLVNDSSYLSFGITNDKGAGKNNFVINKIGSQNAVDYGKTFTLRAEPNGGSGNAQTFNLKYGQSYSLTQPSRTGYTFNGWSVKSSNAGVSGSFPAFGNYNYYGDITVQAKWKKNVVPQFKVVYNADGGTGTVPTDNTTYNQGDAATIKLGTALSKDGMIFSHWELRPGGERYDAGDSFAPDVTTDGVTTFTFYACYRLDLYNRVRMLNYYGFDLTRGLKTPGVFYYDAQDRLVAPNSSTTVTKISPVVYDGGYWIYGQTSKYRVGDAGIDAAASVTLPATLAIARNEDVNSYVWTRVSAGGNIHYRSAAYYSASDAVDASIRYDMRRNFVTLNSRTVSSVLCVNDATVNTVPEYNTSGFENYVMTSSLVYVNDAVSLGNSSAAVFKVGSDFNLVRYGVENGLGSVSVAFIESTTIPNALPTNARAISTSGLHDVIKSRGYTALTVTLRSVSEPGAGGGYTTEYSKLANRVLVNYYVDGDLKWSNGYHQDNRGPVDRIYKAYMTSYERGVYENITSDLGDYLAYNEYGSNNPSVILGTPVDLSEVTSVAVVRLDRDSYAVQIGDNMIIIDDPITELRSASAIFPTLLMTSAKIPQGAASVSECDYSVYSVGRIGRSYAVRSATLGDVVYTRYTVKYQPELGEDWEMTDMALPAELDSVDFPYSRTYFYLNGENRFSLLEPNVDHFNNDKSKYYSFNGYHIKYSGTEKDMLSLTEASSSIVPGGEITVTGWQAHDLTALKPSGVNVGIKTYSSGKYRPAASVSESDYCGIFKRFTDENTVVQTAAADHPVLFIGDAAASDLADNKAVGTVKLGGEYRLRTVGNIRGSVSYVVSDTALSNTGNITPSLDTSKAIFGFYLAPVSNAVGIMIYSSDAANDTVTADSFVVGIKRDGNVEYISGELPVPADITENVEFAVDFSDGKIMITVNGYMLCYPVATGNTPLITRGVSSYIVTSGYDSTDNAEHPIWININ